ncbi:MAG: alpha/beta fold hydrolase, partial [Jannaschia sp.]
MPQTSHTAPFPTRRRVLLGLAAASVTGCAAREGGFAPLVAAPEAARTTRIHAIVQRRPMPGQGGLPTRFGHDRSGASHLASYEISVPAGHRIGQLELGDPADPARHFALLRAQGHDRRAFLEALRRDGPPDADLTLFVHGYNNTHAEAVLRQAQTRTDFAFQGPVVLYSWASLGSPFGYIYDRDSAGQARDGLEAALRMLTASQPRRVTLVAHSMGAWIAMEALRQIALAGRPLARALGGLALVSPDIDIDVFRQQAARIGALPQPTLVLVSQT